MALNSKQILTYSIEDKLSNLKKYAKGIQISNVADDDVCRLIVICVSVGYYVYVIISNGNKNTGVCTVTSGTHVERLHKDYGDKVKSKFLRANIEWFYNGKTYLETLADTVGYDKTIKSFLLPYGEERLYNFIIDNIIVVTPVKGPKNAFVVTQL